ncbi:hypothetical protein PT974_04762 [Cladobotryum mycophilum]|uniref:Fungal STAND N-terminal Goodbye domain-containing protein n=1 Tax=Cladobotryum mycophilum TaxID=491253 RepID=A0ABR0SRE0_9HYPO
MRHEYSRRRRNQQRAEALIDSLTGQEEVDKVDLRRYQAVGNRFQALYRDNVPQVVRRGCDEKSPDGLWKFWTAIGDLFCWIKRGIQKVIKVVKDDITGDWEFFVEIAGKVYKSVLDAVMGAIERLFENDFKRTKQVLHNVKKLYLKHHVDQIGAARVAFRKSIDAAGQKLLEWTGIWDWSSLGMRSSCQRLKLKGAFRWRRLWGASLENSNTEAEQLIKILLNTISAQGKVLSGVYNGLRESVSGFKGMNVWDIIKAIVAILGTGMRSSD